MAKIKLRQVEGGYGCPDCDYTHHEPGGVRLHHYRIHGEGKKKAKDVCPICGGEWRALNGTRSQLEAAAIEEGYSKVCKGCEEIA